MFVSLGTTVPNPGHVRFGRGVTETFFRGIHVDILTENPFGELSIVQTFRRVVVCSEFSVHVIDARLSDLESSVGVVGEVLVTYRLTIVFRLLDGDRLGKQSRRIIRPSRWTACAET